MLDSYFSCLCLMPKWNKFVVCLKRIKTGRRSPSEVQQTTPWQLSQRDHTLQNIMPLMLFRHGTSAKWEDLTRRLERVTRQKHQPSQRSLKLWFGRFLDYLIPPNKFDIMDTGNTVGADSLFGDDEDKTDYQYYYCNGNSSLSTQASFTVQFLFTLDKWLCNRSVITTILSVCCHYNTVSHWV